MRLLWSLAAGCMRTPALVGLLVAAGVAQEPELTELRRWGWNAGVRVTCGAGDVAGTVVALGQRDDDSKPWQVVLYEPRTGQELRRLPLDREPSEIRFLVADHVDVRTRNHDGLFSTSHWHRLRLDDGTEVGTPVPRDLAEDNARLRTLLLGRTEPGPEPCVYRKADGAVCWYKDGRSVALTDCRLHGLALTADGRFAAAWLNTRIAIVPVVGGEPTRLDIAGEDLRGVLGGEIADELYVVTATDIRLVRASTGRELRRVAHGVESFTDVALAPGGGLLAFARAGKGDTAVLVDLATGRQTLLECTGTRVAWSLDGRRVLVSMPYQGKTSSRSLAAFGPEGQPLWDYEEVEAGFSSVVPIDARTDWATGGSSRRVVEGKSDGPGMDRYHEVAAALSPTEAVFLTGSTSSRRVTVENLESGTVVGSRTVEGALWEDRCRVAPARVARRFAVGTSKELLVLGLPATPK